jgi:polyhydroxybutyrate depolymerase
VRRAAPLLAAVLVLLAASAPQAARAPAGVRRTWTIGGTEREAIVHLPATPGGRPAPSPVVFAFHGHGGRAQYVQRTMAIHEQWPGAVVVYPQGLPTATSRDPEGGRPGWQMLRGGADNRDLRLFDAMLASLRAEGWVDDTRVFATGHSNGAGFTYLLWQERHADLAGVAPVAGTWPLAARLQPLPCMHVAGRADEIVRFDGQERTMAAVRRVDGCAGDGAPWAKDCTRWDSPTGTPFVAMVTDGTHAYPAAAPPLIVRFLREQRAPLAFGPPAPGQPWPRGTPLTPRGPARGTGSPRRRAPARCARSHRRPRSSAPRA